MRLETKGSWRRKVVGKKEKLENKITSKQDKEKKKKRSQRRQRRSGIREEK